MRRVENAASTSSLALNRNQAQDDLGSYGLVSGRVHHVCYICGVPRPSSVLSPPNRMIETNPLELCCFFLVCIYMYLLKCWDAITGGRWWLDCYLVRGQELPYNTSTREMGPRPPSIHSLFMDRPVYTRIHHFIVLRVCSKCTSPSPICFLTLIVHIWMLNEKDRSMVPMW